MKHLPECRSTFKEGFLEKRGVPRASERQVSAAPLDAPACAVTPGAVTPGVPSVLSGPVTEGWLVVILVFLSKETLSRQKCNVS